MPATLDVELRDHPAQRAVVVDVIASRDEIGGALSAALRQIGGYLHRHAVAPEGPPFAHYLGADTEGRWQVAVGFPVSGPVEDDVCVRPDLLPAGRLAVVTHHGPYDELPRAWEVLRGWMAESGARPAGAPWESYLTNPEDEPDPSARITQICQPVTGV